MACSFALGAPRQFGPLAGLEHGRTIPLAEAGPSKFIALPKLYSIISSARSSTDSTNSNLVGNSTGNSLTLVRIPAIADSHSNPSRTAFR